MELNHLPNNCPVLPNSFQVIPERQRSKLVTWDIIPIKRFGKLDVSFLQKFRGSNSTIQDITWIQLDARTLLEYGVTNYYIKIQKPSTSTTSTSSYKLGVLFHYQDNIYGIYKLHSELRLKSLKDLKDDIIEECPLGVFPIPIEELQKHMNDVDFDIESFTMTPPSKLNPVTSNINSSPLKDDTDNKNPGYYLSNKYHSALYGNADLMFFAKSTFARLKVLCGSDLTRFDNLLMLVMLDIDDFKLKYELPNHLFFAQDSLNPIELQHKIKFLESSIDFQDEAILLKLKNKLKIREIKLQLVILMELVISKEKTESKSSSDQTKKAPTIPETKKKVSLVRKKNKKRTLIPTLMGTVVEPDSIDDVKPSNITLEMCKAGVRKYLDMLIIVESIAVNDLALDEFQQDTKQQLKQQQHQHPDIIDFLANVIVPFYYKKCPLICKELIKTAKGVSMKRKPSKNKKLQDPKLLPKKLPELQPGIDLPMKGVLVRTASNLDGLLMEKPTLKRTSSLISSTKLLEKRTIDFSASKPPSQPIDPLSLPIRPMNRSKSARGIFGTALPLKKQTDSVKQSSVCEIGETPAKRQKTIMLDTALLANASERRKLFEVEATPDKKVKTLLFEEVEDVYHGSEDNKTTISSSPLSLKRKSSLENESITSPSFIPSSPPAPIVDLATTPASIAQNAVTEILSSPPFKFPPPTSSAIRRKQRELKPGHLPKTYKRLKLDKLHHRQQQQQQNQSASPKPGDPVYLIRSPVVPMIEGNRINGSPYERIKKDQK